MCPSCGGKLKMHKASRGVVIFLHQLCLQCDYTYEWKSLVDGNVPAAEDRHRTGSSKAAAADETSSSVSEAPEMAAVMNEESDSEDEPEESSDPDDVDSDEDWKPAAGAFTVELFPAKRNEEVDKRAGYSDYLEAAPPYNRLCTDCGTFFDRRTPHMCNHKVKPYSCNICGKRFVSKVALNHHNEIHNENYEFSCKFCHVSFKAKADKFTHEQIHIAERNSYKCPDCSRTFATNKELRIHLEEHKMQMQVKCHLCEMEFVSLSSLRRHMTVHTGVKRFTCFVCQRTFNQKGNLKTHMRLHTGEKPYKCQLCDKCFTQNVSLKLHIQRCHTFSSGPELERSNEQEHDSDDARANGDETGEDFGFDSIKEEQDANDVQMDQRRLPKIKKKSTSGSKGRPRNSGSRNIVLEDDAKYHGSNIRSKAHVKRQKMTDEDSKNTPSDSNASFDSAEEEEMWTMNTERQTRGAKPDMKVCSRNKSGKRKGRPRKNLK
ncbi:zinc finger protein 239 [Nematolebias whitei]|uniref:zinc finger protein 239 n=1 Tax=Nematolebias whitei TaxID=451745 RepID=UPI00189B42A4|nr:zinc finger protein 239 [Nematolebias whitei]